MFHDRPGNPPIPSPPPITSNPEWRETDSPAGVRILGARWIEVDAPHGKKMLAALFRPPGPGPFPVVVELHGSDGFRPRHIQLAEALAKSGLLIVAGGWFGIPPDRRTPGTIIWPDAPQMPGLREGEGIFAAVDVVMTLVQTARALPSVLPDRVGLFGFSRGSHAATAVALTGADVRAVVAVAGYAPANDEPSYYSGNPAPVSHPSFLVANLKAAILILHGTGDERVPVERAVKFENCLRGRGKIVEACYYDGAPHDFPFRVPWRDDVRQRANTFFTKHLVP